jgi:hypothetical protein
MGVGMYCACSGSASGWGEIANMEKKFWGPSQLLNAKLVAVAKMNILTMKFSSLIEDICIMSLFQPG